jgi:hypothetical protein
MELGNLGVGGNISEKVNKSKERCGIVLQSKRGAKKMTLKNKTKENKKMINF